MTHETTGNSHLSDERIGFVSAGSLPVPRWYGRLVRFVMGAALLLWLIPSLISVFPILRQTTSIPTNISFWLIVFFALANVQHVVNLGLGRSWGRWPQAVSLAIVGGVALLNLGLTGQLWGPFVSLAIFVWLLAVYLPLGVAFVLAGLLGTPGCEMRSFNHLTSRFTGSDPVEHFCPGGIDFVDRWGR